MIRVRDVLHMYVYRLSWVYFEIWLVDSNQIRQESLKTIQSHPISTHCWWNILFRGGTIIWQRVKEEKAFQQRYYLPIKPNSWIIPSMCEDGITTRVYLYIWCKVIHLQPLTKLCKCEMQSHMKAETSTRDLPRTWNYGLYLVFDNHPTIRSFIMQSDLSFSVYLGCLAMEIA